MKKYTLSLATILALTLGGCGSGGSSDVTDTTSTTITGQLVDSYVQNARYFCADGSSGLTDASGTFSCKELPVRFQVGNIEIGSISTITSDAHIFPQDLLGVARDDIENEAVIALAQLLQTLDSDNNPENGINIDETLFVDSNSEVTNQFDINEFNNVVSKEDSIAHLQRSMNMLGTLSEQSIPTQVSAYVYSPKTTLSDEVIEALKYMGDEERLAYDVYNELYSFYMDQNEPIEIKQLYNIPTKSEINHIAAVKAIVTKYEITSTTLYDNDVSELSVGTLEISQHSSTCFTNCLPRFQLSNKHVKF